MSRTAPPPNRSKEAHPWWAPEHAEHGAEICAHCGHPFPHHTARRCEDCDAPLCPICAAEECHHCEDEKEPRE